MSISAPIPQKLPSNQFDHFYLGGERIGILRHGPGGPMRPEEWIGSITTRFGETSMGLSKLEDGELLVTKIHENPKAWLGDEHFKQFGASTEILVKLLDPSQRLPVHFHPNRSFSRKHLGLTHLQSKQVNPPTTAALIGLLNDLHTVIGIFTISISIYYRIYQKSI